MTTRRSGFSRDRRRLLTGLAGATLLGSVAARAAPQPPAAPPATPATAPGLLTRPIPASGEPLPVVGLGTSRTFDVGGSPAERGPLAEVLRSLVAGGGTVLDSSPMYGRAEAVAGELLAGLGKPRLFLATKVWADGREAGIRQMEQSLALLGTDRLDLMQVHNLRDWRTHLATLREWQAAGRVRYVGITTSRREQHDEFAAVMRTERLDFVQLNYSLGEREAERVLLPLARDRGMAVLANRPFMRAELFSRVRGKALPPWAADIGCATWGQFFMKFILGHPAVTAVIPATASVANLRDNLAGGTGRLPDEALRQRMAAVLA